jgi:hypothetical protein
MKTTADIYLSRNFVEFGPFTAVEVAAFSTRGILFESDYIREGGEGAWVPCMAYQSATAAPAKPAPKKKAAIKKTAA